LIDLASGLISGFSAGFAVVDGGVVGVRFSSSAGLPGAVVVRPGFPGVVEGLGAGVPFCCRFDFSSRRFGLPVSVGLVSLVLVLVFTPLALGLVLPGVVAVGAVADFGAGGAVPLPGTGSVFCGLNCCCGAVLFGGDDVVVFDGAFTRVVGAVPGFAAGLTERLGGGGTLPC